MGNQVLEALPAEVEPPALAAQPAAVGSRAAAEFQAPAGSREVEALNRQRWNSECRRFDGRWRHDGR
jgi:hypothetical protein